MSGASARGDGDGAVGLDHRVGIAVGRELNRLLVVSSQCRFDALQRLLERRTGLVGELIVGGELAGELDLDVLGRDASLGQMVTNACGEQVLEADPFGGEPDARGVEGRELADFEDVFRRSRVDVGEAERDAVGDLGQDALRLLGIEDECSGRVGAVSEEDPRPLLHGQAALVGDAPVLDGEFHRVSELLDPLLDEHIVPGDGHLHLVARHLDVGQILDLELHQPRDLCREDVGVKILRTAKDLEVVRDPQLDVVLDGDEPERGFELRCREQQFTGHAAAFLGFVEAELIRAVADADRGEADSRDGGDHRPGSATTVSPFHVQPAQPVGGKEADGDSPSIATAWPLQRTSAFCSTTTASSSPCPASISQAVDSDVPKKPVSPGTWAVPPTAATATTPSQVARLSPSTARLSPSTASSSLTPKSKSPSPSATTQPPLAADRASSPKTTKTRTPPMMATSLARSPRVSRVRRRWCC